MKTQEIRKNFVVQISVKCKINAYFPNALSQYFDVIPCAPPSYIKNFLECDQICCSDVSIATKLNQGLYNRQLSQRMFILYILLYPKIQTNTAATKQ